MKTANNRAETVQKCDKKYSNTYTNVNENKRLYDVLDAIMKTLQDIKVLLDKKKPLSSEDLQAQRVKPPEV